MSLRESIFPEDPSNPNVLVQTSFVGSWESQFVGLGRLTAFLASQLPQFSAADDDLGLGVVFLHRHRVEVGLKLLLERACVEIDRTHDLDALAESCRAAFVPGPSSSEWAAFWAEQEEYVSLLDSIDPSGFAYRYPVDTKSRPVVRPKFIDLEELEQAGRKFAAAVMGLVDIVARRVPLEVDAADIEATAQEIAAGVRGIRSMQAVTAAQRTLMTRHGVSLGIPGSEPTPEIAAARSKADTHFGVLQALEQPLFRLLDQLGDQRKDDTPLNLDPAPLPAEPVTKPGLPLEMRESILRLEKWTVDTTVGRLRELKEALRALERRTASWTSVAGRQLHNDIERFLSRS